MTGLVHVSEMSATRVESASEIVDVGEKVWIKVIGREVSTHIPIEKAFVYEVCRSVDCGSVRRFVVTR